MSPRSTATFATATRRLRVWLVALLAGVVIAGTVLASTRTVAVPAGSRVPWQGSAWYLHGANLPWFNWGCDFGCGSASGVSNFGVTSSLDAQFSAAHAAGMHVIRWWAFEGNAWQVRRDANGTPTSLDSAVYADFDAALALATKYDLYYDFVLVSAPTAIPTAWETDAATREALANALAPLFARYATNAHVFSWEVFNEPEWDIWNAKIDQASVQATVRAIAAKVHANSGAYVTVGSAMLDGLPMWIGMGLDYYSAHWYDYMSSGNWCAICATYSAIQTRYGLDAPLTIGELYAGTDTSGRFDYWYANGYAGAWPWSLLPGHTTWPRQRPSERATQTSVHVRQAAQVLPPRRRRRRLRPQRRRRLRRLRPGRRRLQPRTCRPL